MVGKVKKLDRLLLENFEKYLQNIETPSFLQKLIKELWFRAPYRYIHLRFKLYLSGDYKGKQLYLYCYSGYNSDAIHFAITTTINRSKSENQRWYNFIREYPEIAPGYYLTGKTVLYVSELIYLKDMSYFSTKTQSILDDFISAVILVEQN